VEDRRRELPELVGAVAAQAQYEPAEPPGTHRAPAFDLTRLETRIEEDAASVAGWRREYLTSRFGDVGSRSEISTTALSDLAHVYFLAGRLDEARQRLEGVFAREPPTRDG
jgi:hypothetical protein